MATVGTLSFRSQPIEVSEAMMNIPKTTFVLLVLLLPCSLLAQRPIIRDTPYDQQYHERFPLESPQENDVRSIAIDTTGRVWIATGAGPRYLDRGKWNSLPGESLGSGYQIAVTAKGQIVAGSWRGLFSLEPGKTPKPILEVVQRFLMLFISLNGLLHLILPVSKAKDCIVSLTTTTTSCPCFTIVISKLGQSIFLIHIS